MGERLPFQQMVLGPLVIHRQKNELQLKFTLSKNNLKWTKDLNVKCQTTILLDENKAENFWNLGLGEELLDMILKEEKIW